MNRRSFLRGLIAAPAVVAASHIMPVRAFLIEEPPADGVCFLGNQYVSTQSVVPILWGDGVHDDSDGLQALLNSEPVEIRMPKENILWPTPAPELGCTIPYGNFYLTKPISLGAQDHYNRRDLMLNPCFKRGPGFPAGANIFEPQGGTNLTVMGAYIGDWHGPPSPPLGVHEWRYAG